MLFRSQPYYKVEDIKVYGSSYTYTYSLKLKLSNQRNITTTYNFTEPFKEKIVNGLADMSDTATETMIGNGWTTDSDEKEKDNYAGFVEVSNFGAVISDTYTSGFQIRVRESKDDWKTFNSNDYGDGDNKLTEFSKTNLVACLSKLMKEQDMLGGEYELKYSLFAQDGFERSDWSGTYTFTYRNVLDGSDSELTQSGQELEVTLPDSGYFFNYDFTKVMFLIQKDYEKANNSYTTKVLESEGGDNVERIKRFEVSKL